MLAARDQENLVHGHQRAAAAKPLNQGTRGLAPKTPGNKVPNTPIKLPLKDENATGAGKTGLKKDGLGKGQFVTPSGPRNRAPLGAKSTNAKIKGLQTPAGPAKDGLEKTLKKAPQSAKPKEEPAQAELAKPQVDTQTLEEDVPDIEYMPPKAKDLPDYPDDLPPIDFSILQRTDMFQSILTSVRLQPDADGLTWFERKEKQKQTEWSMTEKRHDAQVQLEIDSMPVICAHEPECPGEVCKDTFEKRKQAKALFDKTMAIIEAEAAPKKAPKPSQLKTKGPSTVQSKEAANALARPNAPKPVHDPTKKAPQPATTKLTSFRFGKAKPTTTPAPTNPSSMRHAAAVAGSRSTIGPAKGRAVSATLRRAKELDAKPSTPVGNGSTFVPYEDRDTSVSPSEYYAQYGEPPLGSNMWTRCWRAGLIEGTQAYEEEQAQQAQQAKEEEERRVYLDEQLREEALNDFQLSLG